MQDAVVLARGDAPGSQQLVAYYVPSGSTVDAEHLRTHLGNALPDYMVPAAYVALDDLPLTPNGKLDRKALPAPEDASFARRAYEAPIGETEETLAQVWSELLNVERISRHDNFFELGGHSLLAVRLVSRLRESLGIEPALADLFARPVLRDFAQTIAEAVPAAFGLLM